MMVFSDCSGNGKAHPKTYAIRQRLRAVMKPDQFAGADGRYVVRSIYFDNMDDKALREKINGAQKREKFRIRYYNDDLSFISSRRRLPWFLLKTSCEKENFGFENQKWRGHFRQRIHKTDFGLNKREQRKK